jgi:hypothetical protein
MQIFCKKCNTPAYDDSSFFCYKCGMQLPIHIREKKKDLSQTLGIKVPFKKSMNVRDDTPSLPKPVQVQPEKPGPMNNALPQSQPASVQMVKPRSTVVPDNFHGITKLSASQPANLIETCAQCGGPILDKNRIFCYTCGKYIREEPSDVSSIVNYPDQGSLRKSPVAYHNPQIEKIKELGVVLSEEMHILPKTKNKLWLIAIIIAIALLFFIYILMLLSIYLAEANNPFPILK